MKTAYVVAALMLFTTAHTVSAQDPDFAPGRAYELTVEVPLRQVTLDGQTIKLNVQPPRLPARYSVVDVRKDSTIVRFWDWVGEPDLQAMYVVDPEGPKFFAIATSALAQRSTRIHSRAPTFTAGVVLIPVKMRFGEFDFSKDVTLGPSAGMRLRTSNYNDWYASAMISFGITSVSVDSASSNGSVKEPLNLSAVTPALGLVLDFDGFQLGAFTGIDLISNNSRFNWTYHGQPWLSIGLGYSILSRSGTARTSEGDQQKP